MTRSDYLIYNLFTTILISMSLFQIFGGWREDWPFSFFGVYRWAPTQGRYEKVTGSIIAKGVKSDIYKFTGSRFKLFGDLREIALGEKVDHRAFLISESSKQKIHTCNKENERFRLIKSLRSNLNLNLIKREFKSTDIIFVEIQSWQSRNSNNLHSPHQKYSYCRIYVHEILE